MIRISVIYKLLKSRAFRNTIVCGIFCVEGIFKIHAQAPEIQWQNTIGGNKEDVIYSCKKTLDDGFILGGTSSSTSSGDKSENNMGLSATTDYWIVKTDAAGNIEWENTIGGNKDDELRDIIPTADGGYLAAGFSYSGIGGDKTESRISGPFYADYWVLKLNATGDILWQNTIGGGFDDELYCVIENEDGSFYLGGQSSSEIGADKTENAYAMDVWIVQINETGNIIWQTTIGGLLGDYLTSMKKTSDGGLILGCYSYSEAGADKSENCYGYYDYWIVKLDASGIIEWENTIGGNNPDYLNDITEIPGGGYLAIGGSSSDASGEKSTTAFGGFGYDDYWIIKLDANGNLIWEKIYGGDSGDYATCVTALSDGNFLIGGNSSSQISGNKTTGTFEFTIDIWIIKIDSDGNIIWENSIGGDGYDYVLEMPIAADGGVLLGGFSYSGISGDKTEANNGIADFADLWIIKNYPEICPIPVGIFANNITPNKATIHWDNILGADNYQIWYRQIGIGPWIKKTTAINSKTLKSLMPETDYEYKIRVLCADGSYGDFSEIYSFTTLSLRSENNLISNYTVAQNPAGEKIIINGLLPAEANMALYDVTGRKINEFNISDKNFTTEVNLNNLPAGIYYITIVQNNLAQTIQFIHQ
ncbi:MAG: T9SS type A sorting domain-containing protein [Bacteroidetes bacterium]|nr:T9SS type A sorting domain-containing protein [Bacteroidota bacterium]